MPLEEDKYSKPSELSGDDRDAMLADMGNIDDETLEAKTPEAEPKPEIEEEIVVEEEDESEEQAEEGEEESEEEDPEESDDDDAEPDTDPEPDELKSLAAEQQREKRFKERMASERAAFAQEQAEFKELLAEAQELKNGHDARQRLHFDPTGKSADELLSRSKQLYAMSKAAGPNATHAERTEAKRLQTAQTVEARLTGLENENKALKTTIENKERQAQAKIEVDRYVGDIAKASTPETPLVHALLNGKGAEKARSTILSIAAAMHEQSGERPDAADVLAVYEDSERAWYEERNLNPDVVAKARKKKTKKKTPEAGEKTSATLGNDLGSTTKPRKGPMTRREEKADVLRDLESGNFSS